MITYRRATADDIPQLEPLVLEYFEESPHRDWLQPAPGTAMALASLYVEHGAVFIAIDGETPVGIIAVVMIEHPIGRFPYVEDAIWFVAKAYRASRIGPKLLKRSGDWAVEQGARVLKMTAPHGTSIGRYLESEGFRPVETSHIKVLSPPG